MKLISVLVVCLAAILPRVWSGVTPVTKEIEEKALALWEKFCAGASEGGNDEGAFIYCKKSSDVIEESLEHEAKLESGPTASEQIVFVQIPSYHYKHTVKVTGTPQSVPKTVIYVKPAKNTHEVNVKNINDEAPAAAPKPTLYFLKGNHGGDEAPTANAAPAADEAPAEEAPAEEAPAEPTRRFYQRIPQGGRTRRHHVAGHDGHGVTAVLNSPTVLSNPQVNGQEVVIKEAKEALPAVPPTPIVYILKMTP